MKSSELLGGSAAFEAEFQGGKVTGRFDPSVLTRRYTADKTVAEAVAGTLLEWDLQNPDGSPCGTDLEAIGDVPGAVVLGVWDAINEANVPNPTR